jgi:hypothetical protein
VVEGVREGVQEAKAKEMTNLLRITPVADRDGAAQSPD